MTERPIIFSAPMVRALLAGTKTQTRRVVKPVGNDGGFVLVEREEGAMWPHRSDDGESCFVTRRERDGEYLDDVPMRCPYGRLGDRLWVRETWARNHNQLSETRMDRSYVYRADGETRAQDNGTDLPWRPSIHMPRWASRITLEVTGVRVERLQDISEADVITEGIERSGECNWRDYLDHPHNDFSNARRSYRSLWESINGPGSWDANPWVWVVEFRRL